MKTYYLSRLSKLAPLSFVALTCLALATQPARAMPLSPGASELGSPELKPDGAATVLDTLISPFSTSNYSGFVESRVLSGDTTNKLGGLTFTYVLSNDAKSINVLERLTVLGFAGMTVDVSYNPVLPVVGVAPSVMDRSSGSGDTIGWQFVGPPLSPVGYLDPGDASYYLVVQTGVQNYTRGVANAIDGVSTSVAALVPVPEPASLALAACGAVGLALVVHRARRRS